MALERVKKRMHCNVNVVGAEFGTTALYEQKCGLS